jgi:hypothetical protein
MKYDIMIKTSVVAVSAGGIAEDHLTEKWGSKVIHEA